MSLRQRQVQEQYFGATHYSTMQFSLAPGETKLLPVQGDWLDLLSINNSTYTSCVYFALNSGNPMPLSYLPVRSPFSMIRLYNACGASVSGVLVIGQELFQPAKISVSLPSTVSVIISNPVDSAGNVKVNVQSPLDNSGNIKISIQGPLDSSGNVKVGVQNFPLDASGNIKTSVQNFPLDSSGNIKVGVQNFPLDASGNIKVNIQGPLDSSGYLLVRRMAGYEVSGWVTSGGANISNLAITANGSSDTMTLPIGVRVVTVTINITSVSGTSPSIQFTYNYVDPTQNIAVPLVSTSSITAQGAYYIQVINPPTRYFKISWTVGGTSPSFTTSMSYYGWL